MNLKDRAQAWDLLPEFRASYMPDKTDAFADFPYYLNRNEARIAHRLINILLIVSSHQVRIHDKRGWATEWTRDKSILRRKTGRTTKTIFFLQKDAEFCGLIVLTHGRGRKAISYFNWNPAVSGAESFIKHAVAYARG